MTPKVSVIVPVYNVETYVAQCIESILNQNLKELEIICVNDGSTDDSLSILEAYSKKDQRVRVFTKENEGAGEARNFGLKKALGTYIGFVDADDWISPEMYFEMCGVAQKNASEIVICEANIYDEQQGKKVEVGRKIEKLPESTNEVFNYLDDSSLMFKLSVSPCNKLYKKDFLTENNMFFSKGIFEDNAFFFQAFLAANRNSLVRKKFYFQRINREGSNVTSKNKAYFDIFPVFDQIEKIIREKSPASSEDFLKYKLNNFGSRLEKINDEYKNDFFLKIKEDFLKIDDASFKNLNVTYSNMYKNVKTSSDYKDFQMKQLISTLDDKYGKIIKEKEKLIREKEKLIREKEQELKYVTSSTSWKITQPLRSVMKVFKK